MVDSPHPLPPQIGIKGTGVMRAEGEKSPTIPRQKGWLYRHLSRRYVLVDAMFPKEEMDTKLRRRTGLMLRNGGAPAPSKLRPYLDDAETWYDQALSEVGGEPGVIEANALEFSAVMRAFARYTLETEAGSEEPNLKHVKLASELWNNSVQRAQDTLAAAKADRRGQGAILVLNPEDKLDKDGG